MADVNEIERDVICLKVDQAKISEKVEGLSRTVSGHVKNFESTTEKDDRRHLEQQQTLFKLEEGMKSVSSGIKQFIPELSKKIDKLEVTSVELTTNQQTHKWFFKSIIAMVIIAAFGSIVNSALTFNLSTAQDAIFRSNNKENVVETTVPTKADPIKVRRQTMGSTEANRNKWE